MSAAATINIDQRFRGPTVSGNGGYVCGILAKHLQGSVEVRLSAPPPLDQPLTVTVENERASLADGEQVIGVARRGHLDIDVPAAVSLADAEAAQAHCFGFDQNNPYPECFVCGPARERGDGLRIFPGIADGQSVAAARWRAASQWADADGNVVPEIVWAALDCPSYFGLNEPGLFALLGSMTAQIDHALPAGRDYVVLGWQIGRERRKYFAGSAVFDGDGKLMAAAKTIWIRVS